MTKKTRLAPSEGLGTHIVVATIGMMSPIASQRIPWAHAWSEESLSSSESQTVYAQRHMEPHSDSYLPDEPQEHDESWADDYDLALIESQKNEPTISMEEFFNDLGV